jgi:phosphomannomutase/phosphoglucomutase
LLRSKKLFGTNGIRGLANKELTPEVAVKAAMAIGTFFKRRRLIVGHDARTSGPMLTKAVNSGLTATGCDVYLVGMLPTPTLQFSVKKRAMDGAVMITASHNPPEYNGIKVMWNDGIEISHEQESEIERIFFNDEMSLAEWRNIGQTRELSGIIREYVESIKTHVNVERIREKNYHVVVDAGNSVGALASPLLLRDLGCRTTTINADIDGTFPGRPPEPRPENLTDLARVVKSIDADMGVAYDGDADRSIFVDETGEVHMGDKTFALAEKYFLKENPNQKIVTPISSSTLVQDVADANQGEIVWTKVGSVTVAQKMKELKTKLGGEENGGIFYGPHQPVRDGAMSTALILDIMAKSNEKLSKLINELPKYFLEKSKVDCPEKLKEPLLKELIALSKGMKTNTIDGIKIWFNDQSAILIRPSGTEPIYRLYAEAKTQTGASELVSKYTSELKQLLLKLEE